MDESEQGLDWLYTQLNGDSTIATALSPGEVYRKQAPMGATLPYCIVDYVGGHDIAPMGIRLLHEGVYQVVFWGYADDHATALRTANKAADTLLERSSGTTSDANILSCIRDNPLALPPEWDGQQLRIGIGGRYRLQIQAN